MKIVEKPLGESSSNHKMLSKHIKSRVHVRCGKNRLLIGNLMSVDRYGNLLLFDTEEDVTRQKIGRKLPHVQSKRVRNGVYFKQIGVVCIRGSSVSMVCVDPLDVVSSRIHTQYAYS
mmetsp:Transcript_1351/g.2129  ORF Transcript_1351/g.2129 Transcript_1351/m.2129 type:complete len:117 (-) Transcript_1351:46-396(-)